VCYGAEKRQWPADTTHTSRASSRVLRAGAEKRRRADYTRGVPVRGPSGNRPRERSNPSGWRTEDRGTAWYRWRRFGGGGSGIPPPLANNCWPGISARFASSSTRSSSRSLAGLYLNIKCHVIILKLRPEGAPPCPRQARQAPNKKFLQRAPVVLRLRGDLMREGPGTKNPDLGFPCEAACSLLCCSLLPSLS
jgi:hypothetical protein